LLILEVMRAFEKLTSFFHKEERIDFRPEAAGAEAQA
jgi:hypothetical protein